MNKFNSEKTLNGLKYSDPRMASITAGIGYAALFILAVFANFLVKESLIIPGNASETAENIRASLGLFRLGMASFLIVFLIDVFVAWGLYVLFREFHKDISLLAAWFRIVYTVFLGVALVFYFQAIQFLDGTGRLEMLSREVLDAQASVALDSFNSIWLIGLTAFGLHLIVLGFLIVRTKSAPYILGIILILSGSAYILDTLAHTLLADYRDYAGLFTAIVAVPSVLAEGWFGIWLLVKGGKNSK